MCLGPIRVICWNAIYSFSPSYERATHHVYIHKIWTLCLLWLESGHPNSRSVVICQPGFCAIHALFPTHWPACSWICLNICWKAMSSHPFPSSFPNTPSHGFNNNNNNNSAYASCSAMPSEWGVPGVPKLSNGNASLQGHYYLTLIGILCLWLNQSLVEMSFNYNLIHITCQWGGAWSPNNLNK
jgi:hypothetical protein